MALRSAALLRVILACLLLLPREAAAGMALSRDQEAALMSGRSIVQLDESGFRSRVLQETEGAAAANWVVLFCLKGDEHCENLLPSFENLFFRTLDRGNDVRFATMDCSSQASEFCGTLGIDKFPTVAHYRGQERLGQWTSGEGGLVPWLLRQIGRGGQRESTAAATSQRESSPTPVTGSVGITVWPEIWPDLGTLMEFGLLQRIAAMFCFGSAPETRKGSLRLQNSLAESECSTSHLNFITDMILLEDCLFSRGMSFVLMSAILAKVGWIIVTDAELWPKSKHAAPSPNSFY